MKRWMILASLIGASYPALAAETWGSREGECFDWRNRWNVSQDNDGVWSGKLEQVHVGGSCGAENGQRNEADVRAVLVGDYFFATRFRSADGNDCNYAGRLRDDRVRGFYTCSDTPGRLRFVMRFPPAADRANPRVLRDEDLQDEDTGRTTINPRDPADAVRQLERLFRRQ